MRNPAAHSIRVLAVAMGGGSMLLLAYFLSFGPLFPATLPLSQTGRLVFDACLCLFFFGQHSGMIRRNFKERASALVPAPFYPAVYAIGSGVALGLLVLLWQPTGHVLFRLEGRVRWVPALISMLAAFGFVWGVRSLAGFDAFGTSPIRARLRGELPRAPRLEVRGPYRYVRHPLYAFLLVLFWSASRLTSDRLLFDLLWTAWVIAAIHWEERDLLAAFGEPYRQYQRAVPMLVPWRLPRQGHGSAWVR